MKNIKLKIEKMLLKIIFNIKMYVCICRAVAHETIQRTIADGAESLDEIGARCGAGTGCGICRPALAAMLEHDGNGANPCAACPRQCESVYSSAA